MAGAEAKVGAIASHWKPGGKGIWRGGYTERATVVALVCSDP